MVRGLNECCTSPRLAEERRYERDQDVRHVVPVSHGSGLRATATLRGIKHADEVAMLVMQRKEVIAESSSLTRRQPTDGGTGPMSAKKEAQRKRRQSEATAWCYRGVASETW